MPKTRLARLFLTIAAALAVTPTLATAQDDAVTLPLTPTAADCRVDSPRTIEEVEAIRDASAAATPEAPLITSGRPATNQPTSSAPADEETVTAVTATLVTYYGCVNAGDLLAAAALETDELLGEQIALGVSLSGQNVDDGTSVYDTLAAPPVALDSSEQVTLLGVWDVLVLRTGDLRATVDRTIPGGTITTTDTVSFAPRDDGFLISGVILGPPDQPDRQR